MVEDIAIVNQTLTLENETDDIFSVTLGPDVREYDIDELAGFDLPDGNWTITLDLNDTAGFNGSVAQEFIVDTTAPDVEIIVPADGAFINDNAFDAEWGFAVDVLETPIAVQMVTIDNGTASMTLSVDPAETSVSVADVWGDVLPDGNYTIYVNATDAAGNWENESAAFVIDTEAPDVVFDVPAYTNQVEFDFVWAYEFDPLMTPITSQTLTLDNGTANVTVDVPVGDLTIGSEAVWGDDLAEGAYTLYMNVTDEAGNWENESVNFVVDTAVPTLDVTYPPEFTNDNLVNATWTADGTGSPIDSIDLTVVNETGIYEYGPFSLGDVGNATISDLINTSLADGTWSLEFNVTDMAGNNVVVEYTFMVDTVNPTVTITAPIEGGFVNTTDVEIQFTAVDTGVAQSGIEFLFVMVDGGDWIEIDNISATSYVVIGLAEGPHTVHVRAYDNAGNIGTAGVDFTVDLTAPLVEITSPANDAMFNVNHVRIDWTGSDDGSNQSGLAYFTVKVDDLDWENVGLNVSMNLTGLAEGVHVVMVDAVDNAGNQNITSVSFIVDTEAPEVTIIAPVNGLHTNSTSVQMNWTAVDNSTSVLYIHVWNDTGAFVNLTTEDGYLFVGLTEGAHTLHVQAWDLVGNSQEKSVSIVVDLTAPEIFITHPQNDTSVNTVDVNATWAVTDNLSPIVKIWVAIDNNTLVDVGLNASQMFLNLSVGTHVIHVKAMDSAGNTAIMNSTFVVDLVAPSVVSHLPASGAIVLPDVTVSVTFSEPMNQSSVSFTGITGTKTWNTAGTVVTLTHAALSYATTYNVVVSGKDLAGNTLVSAGASWSFTVKTQVTGTINDDKGNPVVNATVTISQGGVTMAEGVTDSNGHFALLVDGVGTYNITVSKTGFQNLVESNKALGPGETNSLGAMAMTPNADYTLLIVGVVVVVAIILVALYLMRRKPAVKKP
ncbi:MAG: Ig-like domain-containing protein, partial [Methanomassiliicoccales archaeon]|nr:Ig-like domain-containing protein [Methanomassiliicoccales archaeon]